MPEHKIHTDALATLGTILGEGETRDAIHLAVEPIEAGEQLRPGEHVSLRNGKAYGSTSATNQALVGVVDPFLRDTIRKGQRFWCIVYPRTITSLRHVWSHPAFPDAAPPDPRAGMSESERWIRDYASGIPLAYETLMDGAAEWVRDVANGGYGEYLCFGGLLESMSVPKEFWNHYDAVTGKTTPEEHRGSFFTCSC